MHGITHQRARDRLRCMDSGPPALAYWVAAIRETFEETGVLLSRRVPGDCILPSEQSEDGVRGEAEALARSKLLAGEIDFAEVLETLDVTLDAGALEYNGHWLTPECEPRRYETRFFATEVGADAEVTPHRREMVDALWLTPSKALAGNQSGTLPLVFPTLFTLEELEPFTTPREALAFLRGRPVPRRLPILERVEGGVRFNVSD